MTGQGQGSTRLGLAALLLGGCLIGCQPPDSTESPDSPAPPSSKGSGVRLTWSAPAADARLARVEVAGLSQAELTSLTATAQPDASPPAAEVLQVYLEGPLAMIGSDIPPMAGTWLHRSHILIFQPRFPLQEGMSYRAVWRGDLASIPLSRQAHVSLTVRHAVPPAAGSSTTRVKQVFPSSARLPMNLLKFYLHFTAPMSRGNSYAHLTLRDSEGRPVDLPFLELDEELWNPDQTRLTVLFDPGRIKREVKPLEDLGAALKPGQTYTLEIDASWRDAAGHPLVEVHRKTFTVLPPDRTSPDPEQWTMVLPPAGTREPLQVTFDESLDQALAMRVVTVRHASGQTLAGTVTLSREERHWSFAPALPWKEGSFDLDVDSILEDLAGNSVGKPFEVALDQTAPPRQERSIQSRSFTITKANP